MSNKCNEILNYFFKNPTLIFGSLAIVFTLILCIVYKFHIPEFYINKEIAQSIADTVAPREVYQATKQFQNQQFEIVNSIFHVWGSFIALFALSFVCKIKTFKDYIKMPILKKKSFIYIWTNISYLFITTMYIVVYMNDLEKYVYNSSADSLGIPLFNTIFTFANLAIIYFLFVNLLTYITFNAKIYRKIYIFLWFFIAIFWGFFALETYSFKFTYWHLLIDLIYFIWLIFITYTINYKYQFIKSSAKTL